MIRQQVLQLWLSEGALDDPVVGWAFHDGADGRGQHEFVFERMVEVEG